MDKNESPQELILDLVLRRGCEVTIRPIPQAPTAFYICLRHDGKQIIHGFETLCLDKETRERTFCHTIERAAAELLGKDGSQCEESQDGEALPDPPYNHAPGVRRTE